jgi:hypothetical protein
MKLSWLHSGSAVCLCLLLAGCNCGSKKETPAAVEQPAVEQVKQEVTEAVAPATEAVAPEAAQAPVEAPAPMDVAEQQAGK